MPAITVIIPVVGVENAKLASQNIESLVRQYSSTFLNVIVSNNGGCEVVRNILQSAFGFDKINYIELSEQLNMPEHFEYLTKALTTDYFMILPARRMLYRGALHFFHDSLLANKDCVACCSDYSEWEDIAKCMISPKASPSEIMHATDMLNQILCNKFETRGKFWSSFPTGLNGLIKSSFVQEWREKHGQPFFAAISPDITAAFAILLSDVKVFKINEPKFIMTGREISNGNKGVYEAFPKYFQTLGQLSEFKFVPRLYKQSIFASIAEDYFRRCFTMDKVPGADLLLASTYLSKLVVLEYFMKYISNPFNIKLLINLSIIVVRSKLSFKDIVLSVLTSLAAFVYLRTPTFIRKKVVEFRGHVTFCENFTELEEVKYYHSS